MAWVERKPEITEAYAGPSTGGFSLVPPSAVPDVGVDDETRRRLLGDANTPPSWYVGTKPEALPMPAARQGRWVERGAAPPPAPPPAGTAMAAGTVMPKGGQPRQMTANESFGWDLYARMHEASAVEGETKAMGWGQNLKERAAKRYANNLLAIPSLAGDLISSPFRDPSQLIRDGVFGHVPRLTVEDIAAGMRGVEAGLRGEDMGEARQAARENIALREGAQAEEYPISTTAGNVLGDVGTIVTGRMPAGKMVVEAVTKKAARRKAAAELAEMGPKGLRRHIAQTLNSKFSQWIRKTGARTAETSLEGATLSVLNNGDPLEQAAYSAGGQLAGSTLIALAHHPVKSLLGSVVMWQIIQNLTPVRGDSLDWTAQHVLDKATIAGVAGVGAGILGGGRLRGAPRGSEVAENFPRFAESINATLRTNANSLIEQFTNDSQSSKPVIAPVMRKLATDVSAFKPEEIRRLERASMKGGNLAATITEMSANADFKKRMGL